MPRRLLTLPLLVVLLVLGALLPGAAVAQQDPLVPQSILPEKPNEAPPGFRLTPNQAERIAERLDEVREVREENPRMQPVVQIPTYLGGDIPRFEVTYVTTENVVADVYLNGRTGRVLEVWTGPQAATMLARGLEPSVGRSMNEPWIWLPLGVLFLVPFFDPRRPFRLLHLDLLVLLGFGASQYFFNRGEVDVSVPLVYPLLAYLLVRLLLAGFRPSPNRGPLIPYAKVSWLVVGLVALVAFRVVLNAVDSGVIDVGYASVVGADRIMHGEELYVLNEIHGDTYGPVNYLAYVPFELILPWDGTWGTVPAAHAGAIAFDLLAILGLMLLGTRLRPGAEGRKLGLAFGFAWAAYPFTLLALQANTNDALVAVLLVGALLAVKSAPSRGVLLGLGAAAKFAPAALAPLLATGTGDEPRRVAWPQFAVAFAGVVALAIFMYLPPGGLREFYDTTIGFQLGRPSPFSLWGLHPSLEPVQTVLKVLAIGLAGALAFVPKRRDLRQLTALAGAVVIAVQLPVTHWFYFYLVWIAPLALVACMGAYATAPAAVRAGRMD